jgi:hypothetical protein
MQFFGSLMILLLNYTLGQMPQATDKLQRQVATVTRNSRS